jgi:uncharacterized integral membrane protein (TIGR00698 family)
MATPTASAATSSESALAAARRLAPGIALAIAVAVAAMVAAPLVATVFPIPAMVIALLIGIALNGVASQKAFEPGLAWCVKKLLRIAIALLGIRIALGDIVDLGLGVAVLVVLAMVLTVASGFWLARFFQLDAGYGALAGAATAVCGASATLATATVVPNYPQKGADVTFTVVAANAVSTIVMVAYPPLCLLLGLDAQTTGIMLGATIHDMAQVVGAGYAVSEPVGNTAVIVKLFRVFLLLPMVLGIAWWFLRRRGAAGEAKVPVPVFAVVFLALCVVNSAAASIPGIAPVYGPLKSVLVTASNWGLLVAIAALGLGTSPTAILRIGWRHIAVFTGTTLVILSIVTAGLLVLP